MLSFSSDHFFPIECHKISSPEWSVCWSFCFWSAYLGFSHSYCVPVIFGFPSKLKNWAVGKLIGHSRHIGCVAYQLSGFAFGKWTESCCEAGVPEPLLVQSLTGVLAGSSVSSQAIAASAQILSCVFLCPIPVAMTFPAVVYTIEICCYSHPVMVPLLVFLSLDIHTYWNINSFMIIFMEFPDAQPTVLNQKLHSCLCTS